jgi:hypothetical protein
MFVSQLLMMTSWIRWLEMTTYTVSNKHKKAVQETLYYSHREKDLVLEIYNLWRWGVWDITPTNQEEEQRILNHNDDVTDRNDGDGFDPSLFEDYEFIETTDCCDNDMTIKSNGVELSETEFQKIMDETDDCWELEENGWDMIDSEHIIWGPLLVQQIDDDSVPKVG